MSLPVILHLRCHICYGLILLLGSRLTPCPRSLLVIGGGEELQPEGSALLEVQELVGYVINLQSLCAGTMPYLHQFRLHPPEIGPLDTSELSMTSYLRWL